MPRIDPMHLNKFCSHVYVGPNVTIALQFTEFQALLYVRSDCVVNQTTPMQRLNICLVLNSVSSRKKSQLRVLISFFLFTGKTLRSKTKTQVKLAISIAVLIDNLG